MRRVFSILTLLMVISTAAIALPPARQQRAIDAARPLAVLPYRFGGRLQNGDDGIDCQGLVFFALQPLSSCGWRGYSVFPTVSLPAGELGKILLGPVATRDLDTERLEPGDVVWLLGFPENPAEKAIGVIDDKPVWVWHLGLATGQGHFIHADFFDGKVRETGLRSFLAEHADNYAGVVVTRMDEGPVPLRCRRHEPMRRP